MFGREARLSVDIAYGTKDPDPATPHGYTSELQRSLREAYHQVRTNLNTGHQRRKELYDKKVHTSEEKSSMTRRCMDDSSNLHDELVWLHSPALPRGQLKKGPYRVLQRLTDCDYRIQVALGQKKPRMVVNFNSLKLCRPVS